MTYAFNRPDFIEWQVKTFKKFLKEEYRFVVFNDAPFGENHDAIVLMCDSLGLECFDVPQQIHHRIYSEDERKYSIATRRHTDAIQYSLETLGYEHEGTVVIFDGDLFLIRPFSFSQMVEDVEIASVFRVSKQKIPYLWPGLSILAMDRLKDKRELTFYSGKIKGCFVDSGGMTHNYLASHPTLRIKVLDQVYGFQLNCPDSLGDYDNSLPKPYKPNKNDSKKVEDLKLKGFNPKEIAFLLKNPDTINFACGNCFLHYKASSLWSGSSEAYNKIKTALIKEFIEDILND
jgi:hypothetical protein